MLLSCSRVCANDMWWVVCCCDSPLLHGTQRIASVSWFAAFSVRANHSQLPPVHLHQSWRQGPARLPVVASWTVRTWSCLSGMLKHHCAQHDLCLQRNIILVVTSHLKCLCSAGCTRVACAV